MAFSYNIVKQGYKYRVYLRDKGRWKLVKKRFKSRNSAKYWVYKYNK